MSLITRYEEYGVEDPRITLIDGEYAITYSAYSRHGIRIGLAKTEDFKMVERFSFMLSNQLYLFSGLG